MPVFSDFVRCLRWLLLLPAVLLLSGCFQYDLTLRFDHQLHGHIEQVIVLSDRAAAVTNGSLAPWVQSLEARTRQLGGSITATGYHQRSLVVPFTTSRDLVDRFNTLFADESFTDQAAAAPTTETTSTFTIPGLGPISFRLSVDQRSWGWAGGTHLTYDLDLGQLPASSPLGPDNPDGQPWSTLGFRLQTPWGLSQVLPGSADPDHILPNGAQWQLQPGRRYHIDVMFWVPSLVFLGTVVITGLVLLGYVLRYRVWGRRPSGAAR